MSTLLMLNSEYIATCEFGSVQVLRRYGLLWYNRVQEERDIKINKREVKYKNKND